MEIPKRSVRLDDDIWEWLQSLPGKTINDALRVLKAGEVKEEAPLAPPDTRLDETLDLVRGIAARVERIEKLPEIEDIEMAVDVTMQRKIDDRAASRSTGPITNPANIPGVQQGYGAFQRRESSADRAIREKREREERARAQSSVGDDPGYSFEDEYVGN